MISTINYKYQIEFDVYVETFMIKRDADAKLSLLHSEIDPSRIYVPFDVENEQSVYANRFIKERVNLHAYLLDVAVTPTLYSSAFDIVIKFAEDAILKQTNVHPNTDVMLYLEPFKPDKIRSSDSVYLRRKLTQLCARYEVFVTEDWDLFIKELKIRLEKKTSVKRISDLTTIRAINTPNHLKSNETLNEYGCFAKDRADCDINLGELNPLCDPMPEIPSSSTNNISTYNPIGDPKHTDVNMRKLMMKRKKK